MIQEQERLELLAQAAAVLLGATSLTDSLAAILRVAEQMIAADAYAIWGYDQAYTKVQVLIANGLTDEYISDSEITLSGPPPDLGDGLAVADVSQAELLENQRSRYEREGIQSLLVLPLRSGQQQFGTLCFYYRVEHNFDEVELALARTIGVLSAAAISAAQLSEARLASRQELEKTILEQQRAEMGLALLAQAGMILSESLDYRTTLTNLTRAVVPALADWCAVHVVENGQVEYVAVAHADPSKILWAEELRSKYPEDPNAPRGVHQVIRTGQSELMAEIPEELLSAAAVDEEHLRIIRELGLRSYVCVPLRTRSEIIGALTLIFSDSGRTYQQRDIELAEEFGRRAGLAVEKAWLYTESERARAELERSNRAKDEFLGMVSHELRTPITTIFGSARLISLREGTLTDEMRQTLMQGIEAESQKMVSLVENLLILARLDIGQQIVKSSVDLEPIVAQVIEPLTRSGRHVQVEYLTERRRVEAEPMFLEQVLANLLGNAHKYAPAETTIELLVEEDESGLSFRVLDRGPGVEASELNLIFDSFYRSSRTTHLPGKGLGLSICKRLVETLDGRIWARPRPGGGLEVGFVLPIQKESKPIA